MRLPYFHLPHSSAFNLFLVIGFLSALTYEWPTMVLYLLW